MQISGPSKWLNKLKRPQGPGQLVPLPLPLPLPLLYPHLIAFYFSNIYYYRILKRYPNAKMHVRWPRCTSDTTHMHKHTYIGLDIYIYNVWQYPIELYAARMLPRHAMWRARYWHSMKLHIMLCAPVIPSAFIPSALSLSLSLSCEWIPSRI